jgi:1,4-dihydroxy-2-naphthoyl-CoA hydrolase
VRAPVEGSVHTFPAPGTLDDALGFELVEAGTDRCRARFAIERRVQQPFGLVHGGAYAALAESMSSMATFRGVERDGNIAVGQSNHTSFLRPATGGTIEADAEPIHRGRTSWVWDVRFTDDDGRLCAISRVTIAVRPQPDPASSSR